jgi:hypothetical protein
MRLYDKKGNEITADKEQADLMIGSGWSKVKPSPSPVVEKEVKKEEEAAKEVEVEAAPKIIKKISRK